MSDNNNFSRYQCQLNLYHLRQEDTEDAFNIFMVLQLLWQKPYLFWAKNFSRTEKDGIVVTGDVGYEYQRYWNMMRHIEDRTDQQFVKTICISLFLMRMSR